METRSAKNGILTLKQIQSDEPERPAVRQRVDPNEDTLHKAHVGVKEESRVGGRVPAGPLDMGLADKPVKISDRRRLVDLAEHIRRQEDMEQLRPRATGLDVPSGNRFRLGAARCCGMG